MHKTHFLAMVAFLMLGPAAHAESTKYFVFNEMRSSPGHKRGNVGLEVATHACDARVGVQIDGASSIYKLCMRGLGWQYAYAYDQPEQANEDDASPSVESPTASADAYRAGIEYQEQILQSVNEAISQP